MRPFKLMIVTDRRAAGGEDRLCDLLVRALAGDERGECIVQLREKDLEGRALVALAERVRALTKATGTPLYVNDRVDVALAVGADGVHLPEAGLPVGRVRVLAPALAIGASVHDAAGAQRAAGEGADFVTFAPVFAVPGKGPPAGVAALSALARALTVPVVALGGIAGAEEADACRAAGAGAVAAIRAIWDAPDPARAVRQLLGEVVWGCPT